MTADEQMATTTSKQATDGERSQRRLVFPLGPILVVLAVVAAAGGVFAFSLGKQILLADERLKVSNEWRAVQAAVLSYDTEYSRFPAAADNLTLTKILTGTSDVENPRTIAFLSVRSSEIGAKGEIIDPWGTPYQFFVTVDGKFHTRSAGPDKIFGTADDISNQ